MNGSGQVSYEMDVLPSPHDFSILLFYIPSNNLRSISVYGFSFTLWLIFSWQCTSNIYPLFFCLFLELLVNKDVKGFWSDDFLKVEWSLWRGRGLKKVDINGHDKQKFEFFPPRLSAQDSCNLHLCWINWIKMLCVCA